MIYLFAGWCVGWLITFPIMVVCDGLVSAPVEFDEDYGGLAMVSLFLWPVFWAMLAWGLVLYLMEK
jgi:hypothetical protein